MFEDIRGQWEYPSLVKKLHILQNRKLGQQFLFRQACYTPYEFVTELPFDCRSRLNNALSPLRQGIDPGHDDILNGIDPL